jgi:hypothetical protein
LDLIKLLLELGDSPLHSCKRVVHAVLEGAWEVFEICYKRFVHAVLEGAWEVFVGFNWLSDVICG